jgi:uncharacterized protein
MAVLLDDFFRSQDLPVSMQWFCPPDYWTTAPDACGLEFLTDSPTDFWQRTHYAFQADNGHFLHMQVEGDFRMDTMVESAGVHQYDQAGLMVRIDAECWLKTSVEYEPGGPNRLGAVVTRQGYSDWSTTDVHPDITRAWLRVTREASTFIVEAAFAPGEWQQIRLAHLDAASTVMAGLYACSPKGHGFRPRFRYLRIESLDDR